MYSLVILIDTPEDWGEFEAAWPLFLHHAEKMPGLRIEATSRVEGVLYGSPSIGMVHTLYFDSSEAARQAMASAEGREAGRVLQVMTKGRMTLFFADEKRDDLANIRRYQQTESTGSIEKTGSTGSSGSTGSTGSSGRPFSS